MSFVSLCDVPMLALAQPLLDMLDAEGIPYLVQSDDAGGLHPALGFVHGTSLQVRDCDIEAARVLLAKWDDIRGASTP